VPELELWPNEATSSAVGRALTDVEAIMQRASDEGHGSLRDVAEDAISALNDLMQEIDNTVEAQEDTADGDHG